MALPMTLTERRKQAAIDEIARIALELFSRDGFEATSVEAIAAAAGCAPRTFYRYFATKEEVMFHDLPAVIDELGVMLRRHLADGAGGDLWDSVSEAIAAFIGRFDSHEQRLLSRRMKLWLSEPALLARYMQFFNQAERLVAESLHEHRATTPERDHLAGLMAVAAIGAYRVTLLTHTPAAGPALTKHIREALAAYGSGLADGGNPA
jgi:AcrR family transcriptional regulator